MLLESGCTKRSEKSQRGGGDVGIISEDQDDRSRRKRLSLWIIEKAEGMLERRTLIRGVRRGKQPGYLVENVRVTHSSRLIL